LHGVSYVVCVMPAAAKPIQSITADLHALDQLFIEHPELDLLLDDKSPTGDCKIKQKWLVSWYLDLYENIHYQHNKGVIAEELWTGWEQEIKQTSNRPGFREQYKALKRYYNEDFQKFIKRLFV